MEKVGVGLIGSQFVSNIHAEAFQRVPNATLVAVASPTEAHVRDFAARHHIPRWFTDYREMLALPEVQMVVIGAPNYLHCQMTVDAARAGKHVVCEKPLCMNLQEADAMIAACRDHGVKLMYAEELCFTPKYVRLKQLVDEGALGKVYLIKQAEKHDGPHSAWFWDVTKSGGGVTLDMGCHAFEFFRWMIGRPRALNVYAQMDTYVHRHRTQGDDAAVIIVNFEGQVTGVAEESWAKKGGMDDRAEVYGSEGVSYADLLRGNSLHTYSEPGYGYAVEKAGSTRGWSFTMFEETWNYGFPQEMQAFTDAVANNLPAPVSGEDGRAVLEIIFAAYASAATGRRVDLPYTPPPEFAQRPIDIWLASRR
ncbi:MAG: Gfo/Idh/MocA family oxidoreductase [Armatimonadota bacterium]|nr:Gfo/Idh/MocA family oxidoreductase [Armatimonadota bacterium]